MTAKHKRELILSAVAAVVLAILWLLLRRTPVAGADGGTTTNPISETVGPVYVGGGQYQIPGLQIPAFPAAQLLDGGGSGSCGCNSCGCDPTQNTFAASANEALQGYVAAMNAGESNYISALYSATPDYITQYMPGY